MPSFFVFQAATELDGSEPYLRRLLLRQRLYGIKVGPMWAIFPSDLEAFTRYAADNGSSDARFLRSGCWTVRAILG